MCVVMVVVVVCVCVCVGEWVRVYGHLVEGRDNHAFHIGGAAGRESV